MVRHAAFSVWTKTIAINPVKTTRQYAVIPYAEIRKEDRYAKRKTQKIKISIKGQTVVCI